MLLSRIAAVLLLGIHFFPAVVYSVQAGSAAFEPIPIQDVICSTSVRLEGRAVLDQGGEQPAVFAALSLAGSVILTPSLAFAPPPAYRAHRHVSVRGIVPHSRGPPDLIVLIKS